MDWLVEINVFLLSIAVPLTGVLTLVRFKKGGPYGPSGRYISTPMTIGLMMLAAAISYFVLMPFVRTIVQHVCSLEPAYGVGLMVLSLVALWMFIERSRRRKK